MDAEALDCYSLERRKEMLLPGASMKVFGKVEFN